MFKPRWCGNRCGPKKELTLDQKSKFANFRVQMLNKKLGCCSILFSIFALVFFVNGIITLCTARYNSAHIAQTGYLPWVHQQPFPWLPSDEPAKYEFGMYDNFIKIGLLCALISFVLFNFVMRTTIARFLQKEKNSNIAFRRTIYCLVAFFVSYYFLHGQTGKFQEVYPKIAAEKGIPGAPVQPPVDLGGRFLQDFDLSGFFDQFNANLQQMEQQQQAIQQQIDPAVNQWIQQVQAQQQQAVV
jgi:hypothetical protein